ncbi:hypothetical protein [Enterococcus rotai]|uniref:hypothetical protein n=1 Tax=Enterococcus rotai TaxID=118060 RepID=UPI0035C6C3A0
MKKYNQVAKVDQDKLDELLDSLFYPKVSHKSAEKNIGYTKLGIVSAEKKEN